MKTYAARTGTSAIRSRHKSFFKRLDVFLKNYSQGVCGQNVADDSLPAAQAISGIESKERR